MSGVSHLIAYMRRLDPSDADKLELVFKFSEWVLRTEPEQGLEVRFR